MSRPSIDKRTTLRWLMLALGSGGTAGLASLAGCGGGSGDAPPPAPPAPAPPPTATLYSPPLSLQAATPLDDYVVRASYASGVREIPILVRHPEGSSGLLPLVLWSHGGQKSTDGKYNNSQWAAALVSAGYIVVSMTHLPRTAAQVDALALEFGVDASSAGPVAFESNVDRPRDAIATLNDLQSIEAFFPALRGRIDYTRIGLGGHSRGAYTVRTASGARVDLAPNLPAYSFTGPAPTNQPLRVAIQAVLANSPAGPGRFGFYDRGNGDNSWRDCTQPDLMQSGQGDNTDELAVDRVKPFDLMPPGDKFKMFIDDPNTPHDTFNLNNPAQPEFVSYVRSTGLAFFDAYLKGLPAASNYLASEALRSLSGGVATISRR